MQRSHEFFLWFLTPSWLLYVFPGTSRIGVTGFFFKKKCRKHLRCRGFVFFSVSLIFFGF